jgi:hypothetical protein
MPFTGFNKLCKNAGPKPFCWAKLVCFEFFSSNFTFQGHILSTNGVSLKPLVQQTHYLDRSLVVGFTTRTTPSLWSYLGMNFLWNPHSLTLTSNLQRCQWGRQFWCGFQLDEKSENWERLQIDLDGNWTEIIQLLNRNLWRQMLWVCGSSHRWHLIPIMAISLGVIYHLHNTHSPWIDMIDYHSYCGSYHNEVM